MFGLHWQKRAALVVRGDPDLAFAVFSSACMITHLPVGIVCGCPTEFGYSRRERLEGNDSSLVTELPELSSILTCVCSDIQHQIYSVVLQKSCPPCQGVGCRPVLNNIPAHSPQNSFDGSSQI